MKAIVNSLWNFEIVVFSHLHNNKIIIKNFDKQNLQLVINTEPEIILLNVIKTSSFYPKGKGWTIFWKTEYNLNGEVKLEDDELLSFFSLYKITEIGELLQLGKEYDTITIPSRFQKA